MDPASPGHELFYEYHSNESIDPARVLFHALGGWRIAPAFHDLRLPQYQNCTVCHQKIHGSYIDRNLLK